MRHAFDNAEKDEDGRAIIGWRWTVLAFLGMTVVPFWVYWCWICVEFNNGAMLLPKSVSIPALWSWLSDDIWARILAEAIPSKRQWVVYAVYTVGQALLFLYAPGPVAEGVTLEDGKTRLKYKFNGQFAWFATLALAALVHITGVFKLTELYRDFAKYLTIANIWTYALIALLYLYYWTKGGLERRTNSHVFDYYMGPVVNPRFGAFDVKYFYELRIGIMQWFFTTVGCAMMQYETYGRLSWPMVCLVFFHLCFVNACYKGEQCVPVTIDIAHEKFGYMLLMLDIVMVPFIFTLQPYYVYKQGLMEHGFLYTLAIFLLHTIGYWIFDTANSQKDYFRNEGKHDHIGYGFPRLPWDKLENPKFLPTRRGTRLLADGWWVYSRHMNYLGDIMMSWAWGLICGTGSYFPFAYTTYLTPLLIHRERRDDAECQRKYGEDWTKYKRMVPWRIIPYVY